MHFVHSTWALGRRYPRQETGPLYPGYYGWLSWRTRRQAQAAAADPEDYEEPFYPEGHAPARPSARPDRGDAWEPPTDDEDPPTDGRQLLGWSSKQVPDAKGLILSYGRKNGLPSKIVGWSPQQVAAAYRFARGRLASTTR